MACNLPPFVESFIPHAPYVPSVPIATQDPVLLPLILARFDTLERMVLGLYQSLRNPPLMTHHSNPVNAPHVSDASPSDATPSARPKKPVPIVNPDISSSPEHSASATPEPRACDKCSKPFSPSNPKWKICDSCDAARRSDARTSKLRKGKIPCDTADCPNTVSPNSASGLCHVCWWKTHVKCHFCPGTLRSSEESHICGRCRNRFRTWHRISGKNGYRVTEQSGQVGRLFTKGGRFEPFDDQEEASAKLSSYREFITVTQQDETDRANSASRRRADRVKERDTHAEKALSKWKSGLTVTFVPTEHEALQDANASHPSEESIFPVQHSAHFPNIPGMSRGPLLEGAFKPIVTHTADRESDYPDVSSGCEFPVSSGKYHAMMNPKSTQEDFDYSSFDDISRPHGEYPRIPASSKRAQPESSDSDTSLLPKGETFRTSRPGRAIPIIAPPEIRESLFPLVPPSATRTRPTTVSPPLVKDRGSGISDTFTSAPSPALVKAFTTSLDVAPQEVAAQQLPVDSEFTSESLEGDVPKVPRLPQPPPTAAINADTPSQAEITKATVKVSPVFTSTVKNTIMGSLENESDRVTKVPKPDVEVVSKPSSTSVEISRFSLPPASDVTTPVITSPAKDTTPPSKSTFTSSLLTTHDVRLEQPPHYLVDDFTTCTQMCSVQSCLRSGFDKHCVLQAHSGSAHRCDLCTKTYPIKELRSPPRPHCPETCIGDGSAHALKFPCRQRCRLRPTDFHDDIPHRCYTCNSSYERALRNKQKEEEAAKKAWQMKPYTDSPADCYVCRIMAADQLEPVSKCYNCSLPNTTHELLFNGQAHSIHECIRHLAKASPAPKKRGRK